MSFNNKPVVLITGASSGIGEGLAREFSERGYAVGLAARRVDRLQQLAKELPNALAIRCDVTRDSDLQSAVSACVQKWGRLDILIANAGFGITGKVEALQIADYQRQFDTNIFGVIRSVQAALSELKKTRGSIAIIGSVNSYIATPGASPYAMSKYAVRALGEALSIELEGDGVSVTVICPGFVASEIFQVDNQGVYHASAKRPPGLAKWEMPVKKAARQMATAILKRKREKIITGHGVLAIYLKRFIPWIVDAALRHVSRKGGGKVSTRDFS